MTTGTITNPHLPELKLRRLRAGESLGDETAAAHAHTAACPQCRGRLKDLDDEQRRFEQVMSFDRFAAGVEREARRGAQGTTSRAAAPARRWLLPAFSLAAAAALVLVVGGRAPVDRGYRGIKGGSEIFVQVGGASGSQRSAGPDAPLALARGERVRIGYKTRDRHFIAAVSLDDQGAATAVYPENGPALPVAADGQTSYLPDSVEFTGAGREHLIVVLSDQALDAGAVKRAAQAAYQKARGDLLHLPDLDLGGEQFHRTFIKP